MRSFVLRLPASHDTTSLYYIFARTSSKGNPGHCNPESSVEPKLRDGTHFTLGSNSSPGIVQQENLLFHNSMSSKGLCVVGGPKCGHSGHRSCFTATFFQPFAQLPYSCVSGSRWYPVAGVLKNKQLPRRE